MNFSGNGKRMYVRYTCERRRVSLLAHFLRSSHVRIADSENYIVTFIARKRAKGAGNDIYFKTEMK